MNQGRVEKSPRALSGAGGGSHSTLIGREHEAALLNTALARVAGGGSPTVVLLTGPPGIGKTRLAEQGLQRAAHAGFITFSGRAIGLVRDVAYAPFAEAFGGWLRKLDERRRFGFIGDLPQLALVMAGLGVDVPAPLGDALLERARLMEGFARLVERLAAERPLALFVDDLDRADPATAAVLPYLAAAVVDLPVLLLLTGQRQHPADGNLSDLMAELSRSTWAVQELELTRIDDDSARLLVEGLLGKPVDERLAQLVVEHGAGRPLFLEALTRTLVERGLVGERDGTAYLTGSRLPLPADVRARLRERLSPLDTDEQELLALLAASGGSIEAEPLARVLERPPASIIDCLGRLYQRGLVVVSESPVSYDLAHALLRDTVLAELTPMAVRGLHARWAQALLATRPQDPRLPGHVLAAGPLIAPDEALAQLDRGAAHAEHLGATEDMVRYLERAVVVAQEARSVDILGDLLARLCRGRQWLGDTEGAIASGRAAVAAYSAAGEALGVARSERELARLAWARGDLDRARAGLSAARRSLDGLEPSAEHGWLVHDELMSAIRVLDEHAADEAVARLHELVGRLDSPLLRVHAYLAEGARALATTDYVAAAELTLQGLDAAAAGGVDGVPVVRAHDQLSVAAACQADVDMLRQHSEAALQVAKTLGAPGLQWWPRGRLILVDVLAGRWDAALRGCAEVLPLLDRVGERRGSVSAIAAHAWVLVLLGRLSDARRQLDAARDLARPELENDRNVFNSVVFVETSLAVAAGDAERACDVGAPLEELRGGWFPLLAAGALGEARVACGDFDGVRRLCRRIAGVRSCGTELPQALTASLQGHLAAANGDNERAAEHLGVAQREYEQLGLPYQAARTRLALALATADSAEESAVAAGRQALEAFDLLGAPVEARQARELLRGLGVVPSRGRGRSTIAAPLSDRELEVARLVAKGLSNADVASELFISPRTVTTHLNRMYARLGLSSRVALTRYLVDRDLLESGEALPGA